MQAGIKNFDPKDLGYKMSTLPYILRNIITFSVLRRLSQDRISIKDPSTLGSLNLFERAFVLFSC